MYITEHHIREQAEHARKLAEYYDAALGRAEHSSNGLLRRLALDIAQSQHPNLLDVARIPPVSLVPEPIEPREGLLQSMFGVRLW